MLDEKEKGKKLNLSELIDIKFLQQFQDIFAKTMNVASIAVDDNGPITEPSNFTDFCIKYTRESSLGFKRCNDCGINCGRTASIKGEPVIYTCHTGLTDFAVPIMVEGKHLASIIGGQVLTEVPDEEHFRKIATELGIDEDEYIEAVRKIKIVPFENIKAAAELLSFVANTISEISHKNFELIKKNERESLYKKITETIRSSLDIDEALSFICNETAKIFKVQRSTINVYPDSENYEDCTIKKEYKAATDTKSVDGLCEFQKLAQFWGDKLLKTSGVFAVENINDSDTPDFFKKAYNSLGVKSIVGTSISKDKEVWGTLILSEYENYRYWNKEEISLLKTISDQIFIAIKQAELYNTVQKTAQNEKALRQIMLSSVGTFDIKETIKSIVTEAGELFKADRCLFVEYNPDSDSTTTETGYTEYLSSDAIRSHKTCLLEKTITDTTAILLKQKKVLAVENMEKRNMLNISKHSLVDELSVKSYLVAPVHYGELFYGAIVLHYVNNFKKFTQEDIDVAMAVANQSAIVIHKAQLYSTIEKNEKYTRTVFDSIKDGIITISDTFIIESCNPATENIWGYSASEIIGQKLDLLLHHDCKDTNIKACLSKKGPFGIRKNGEEFPIELDVSEIDFEDKKVALLVIRDITEHKKIEKMKNEFVSTVSHELRTPLTSIKGSLGLITSGVLGELPEKVNKMLNIANTNCTRLTNLINDILDLEKIKAGKMEFNYEELEINEILEQSVVLNQPYAAEFGMTLKMVKLVEKSFIKADKNRLLQVISNLISNAVKFSYSGGEVTITSEIENGMMKASFNDKGVGIAEYSKSKIFQSFSQVDSSDTRSKGGSGLGLSICKSIIEKMDGKIDFESEVGEGSTFFFSLPAVDEGSFIKPDETQIKDLNADEDQW